MKDASFSSTLERLFLATKSKTDSALANALGITAQSVSQAKKKQQIPAQWFIDVAHTYGVSVDWLLFGTGSPHRTVTGAQEEQPLPTGEHGLDRDILLDVVALLEEYLEEDGSVLPPKAKAEVIYQLYQLVVESEAKDVTAKQQPIRILRLIKGALAAAANE